MERQILFIADGSDAAFKAGILAIEMASLWKASLRVVYILDEGWGSILGDEWLSTSAARTEFYRWLESSLARHARDVLQKLADLAVASRVQVATEIVTGKTEKKIAELAGSPETLLLVLPNPSATAPPAEAGLKLNLHSLVKKIKCPVLIGPNKRA